MAGFLDSCNTHKVWVTSGMWDHEMSLIFSEKRVGGKRVEQEEKLAISEATKMKELTCGPMYSW